MIFVVLKNTIRKLIGYELTEVLSTKIKRLLFFFTKGISLFINAKNDTVLYYKHSIISNINTFDKVEAAIILQYHAIEKGFLHEKFKFRFGKDRIISLIHLLKSNYLVNVCVEKSQIQAAYIALCRYYEMHKINSVDISDYFPEIDFLYFRSLISEYDDIIGSKTKQEYFENVYKDFKYFASSRKSIRHFSGELIPVETIFNVIELAKTAPSVCNRQPAKVYLIQNKITINSIFRIQGGLTGFTDNVNQLIVLTSDRNSFYSVGERNQLYIDGGIFLMNLLYSLHYYGIGACSAHWALTNKEDKEIQSLINLKESEKVICIISIGIPQDSINSTSSKRREITEILKIIE